MIAGYIIVMTDHFSNNSQIPVCRADPLVTPTDSRGPANGNSMCEIPDWERSNNREMRDQGGQKSLSKTMFLSLGASRGVWNPVERPSVPVPRSPKRRRRAGGTCFGVALPGIRRSARVFACSGRDPLCDPGPAGELPSAQSSRLCAGALGPGAANWGPDQ